MQERHVIVQKPDVDIWFVTGSQHLYGAETLERVARDSRAIVDGLNAAATVPYSIAGKRPASRPPSGAEPPGRAPRDGRAIVDGLNAAGPVPYSIAWKPTAKTAEEIS